MGEKNSEGKHFGAFETSTLKSKFNIKYNVENRGVIQRNIGVEKMKNAGTIQLQSWGQTVPILSTPLCREKRQTQP